MSSLLILNARIVNEGKIFESDILVKKGRIKRIDKDLSYKKTKKRIDAKGKFLLPGMIDDQVHFREPGLTHKATIATESRAAVAGGITSFMDMPNTIPNVLNAQALQQKMDIAAKSSLANYSFYMGASNDNLENIKAVDPKKTCGIKVFMGASTGNMLVDDPNVLEQIFKHAPILVATHCEDTPTILENEESYRQVHGDNIPFKLHPIIRSTEACYLSSSLAVDLAKQHDTRLHVLHISTAKELELFSSIPLKDKKITAEACVHFLSFSDEDYKRKKALIKCNPAIKSAEDRTALLQGLLDNKLDVIGTDHAPHTWEEKQQNYFSAPSGIPLVQHALLSLLEYYHKGTFSLEFIVEKTSHSVANLFNISKRGYIREGYWADFTLIDLDKSHTVTNQNILSKCGWSPYTGYIFRSTVYATIVNGHIVWLNGKIKEKNIGKRLNFSR